MWPRVACAPEFAADLLVVLLRFQLGFQPLDVPAADLQLLLEMRQLASGGFAQLVQRRLQYLDVFDQRLDLEN